MAEKPEEKQLVYVLAQRWVEQVGLILHVECYWVTPLKKGGYGKTSAVFKIDSINLQTLPIIDQRIIQWLRQISQQDRSWPYGAPQFPLIGSNGAALLQQLVLSGHCHWVNIQAPALRIGETRMGTLEWRKEPSGLQQLSCRISGRAHSILPLAPPWYIDHEHHQCGSIETGLAPDAAAAMLLAPPMQPEQCRILQQALARRSQSISSALESAVITSERVIKPSMPIPQLRLLYIRPKEKPDEWGYAREAERALPLAELSFCYGPATILAHEKQNPIVFVEGEERLSIERHFEAERAAAAQLRQIGLKTLQEHRHRSYEGYGHYWLLMNDTEQYELNDTVSRDFCMEHIPALRKIGWQIEIAPNYPDQIILEDQMEWYGDLEEADGRAWFDLELGVMVDGQRVNLLPLLVNLLMNEQETGSSAFENKTDQEKIMFRLSDGRLLPIALGRVRGVLNVLTELYDKAPLHRRSRLRLSSVQAAQLAELGTLQWSGSQRLISLGRKLRHAGGIKEVKVSKNFQAILRPYQHEGLNWLQFLREYELGGILADDMGLGKTVQTLAHILLEKESGRMDRPSLVIAPTSLMANWRMEAHRFAPTLRVLTLHGDTRKQLFDHIQNYDLILTTYPLLRRDHEVLLAHRYHLLILDEAQIIKNPHAQATQIIHRFKTRHRLCLTGTPMENHLGELWSLFHFLMPGLLFDQKRFKRLFRTPIEKLNDPDRRQALAKRVAPFLLRRTKQAVETELPPKTEIIRMVEMSDAQRDLYESIRLAMHDKVIQLIREQGFANSQIVILDALLKLRQICCDPRLLKLKSASHVEASSAKLELLMDMLPNLVEEGRRILLFSQFTGMLKLIEKALREHKIPYVILTGQTKDRASVINQFQNGVVPIFLISLKAGGMGLNLTAADTVIHYDPWWNPAVENQATDRAYRIGQDKPVFVYKLLTAGTVEEKILALQQTKRALMEGLFSEHGQHKMEWSLENIEDLFK